jgi:hypothetical protein
MAGPTGVSISHPAPRSSQSPCCCAALQCVVIGQSLSMWFLFMDKSPRVHSSLSCMEWYKSCHKRHHLLRVFQVGTAPRAVLLTHCMASSQGL